MTPVIFDETLLNHSVVKAVACGVRLVCCYVIKYCFGSLAVYVVASSKAVALCWIECLTSFSHAAWYEHQTAFLIVRNEWQMRVMLLILLHALREDAAERRVYTQVILHDEGTVKVVVPYVLHSKYMLVCAACARKSAVHGVRLAVVGKVAVKYLLSERFLVAFKYKCERHAQALELFSDKKFTLAVALHVDYKYWYVCHINLPAMID